MSYTITLHGDPVNLETHLAAYGAAYAISGSRISTGVDDLRVHTPVDARQVGESLRRALSDVLDREHGWLSHGVKWGGKSYISTVFPTASPFKADELATTYAQRTLLDETSSVEQSESVAALGKAQYWWGDKPMRGASQVLGHLLNPNNDLMVTNFLIPGSGVSQYTGAELLDALETGSGAVHLETEWSPIPSSPVSMTLALLGMWALPTVYRMNDRAITAGCRQRERRGSAEDAAPWADRQPVRIELPLFSAPVSLERVRSVIASRQWLSPEPRRAANAWLREQGVEARIVFCPKRIPKGQHHAFRAGYGEYAEF